MNKALADLIKISKGTGRDRTLVQGGGGNTSVKTDDGKYMYIKASGTALKDMNKQRGWRRMRLDSVLSILKDKSMAQLDVQVREAEVVNRLGLACCDDIVGEARPSIEAHLHALLDKCVIHLHPAAVLAYACAKNGRAELEKLFKNEKYPPLWAAYVDPGFTLAKKIAKLVDGYEKQFGKKPSILFLQKHGLLISANSPRTALGLVRRVINRCESRLRHLKARKTVPAGYKAIDDAKRCIRKALLESTGRRITISHFYDDTIAAFSQRKDARKLLSAAALTPDELLYANGPAMWVEDCSSEKIANKLGSQIKRGRRPAAAFLVKGTGLFAAGTEKLAAVIRDIVEISLFIRSNASRFGGILSLSKTEQDFINQWEAEAFRKRLASGLSKT